MMKFGHYLSILMYLASTGASALSIAVSDQNGTPVANAVITVSPENIEIQPSNTPTAEVYIQQIDRNFSPEVSVIAVNQEVFFPNNDDVLHHVYSFSPTKTFEFALYGKNRSPGVTFDKEGLVVLGCNIHDQMRGYVYVTAAPYFALSDDTGKVSFTPTDFDAHSQNYVVKIWHPEQKSRQPVTETISLEENHPSEVPLEYSIDLKPSRENDFDRHEQGDYE